MQVYVTQGRSKLWEGPRRRRVHGGVPAAAERGAAPGPIPARLPGAPRARGQALVIGRLRDPAGRIPVWMHENRERARAMVDMRSGGDAEAWLEWEALLRLATSLDTLAGYPEWEGGVAATAWQVACWLSERLPEPAGTEGVLSSLPGVVSDLDNNATLREALGDAAAALAATLTAPADAAPEVLRADVAASVAAVTPLLAQWELHGERGARTLHKMRTSQGPPPRPA